MNQYSKKTEIRWSDLDPNFHLRHSVYYDWGAYVRMCFLNDVGISIHLMQELKIGPIIFREEAVFKREIKFTDTVEMNVQLAKCTHSFSRWTMVHEIIKNGDILCANLTIDGAWLDTEKRKLVTPPEVFAKGFEALPKSTNFQWL